MAAAPLQKSDLFAALRSLTEKAELDEIIARSRELW